MINLMYIILMFDPITAQELKFYVYALIDPRTNEPFYIGKGKDNRVYEHVKSAIKSDKASDKLDRIREIRDSGHKVKHIIVRHGLTEDESFKIESSLIDFMNYFSSSLTNEVFGHGTFQFGMKTANEIIGDYNAEPLKKLHHHVIIININKTYERAKGGVSIYAATHESWVISPKRHKQLEYALSEYKGIIVGVYKINEWYPVVTDENKVSKRWGFHGEEAPADIKKIYINKSVKHTKKRGAANPIKYKL
ncbi:hypothetical protein N9861_05720 [Gammaproteobacteria bacterium]|nr:hypothetical protein [Gammaproteobacteria bacterium]